MDYRNYLSRVLASILVLLLAGCAGSGGGSAWRLEKVVSRYSSDVHTQTSSLKTRVWLRNGERSSSTGSVLRAAWVEVTSMKQLPTSLKTQVVAELPGGRPASELYELTLDLSYLTRKRNERSLLWLVERGGNIVDWQLEPIL